MKIKIITPRVVNAEAWTAALATLSPAPTVEAHAKQLRHVNVLVNGIRPDLVLAETTGPEDLDALEALANAHPEIDYVLVSADLQPQALMRMMRAGVREVLPAPTLDSAVAAAVARLMRKHSAVAAVPPEAKQGQVLSFISCKGGSGATFLAANLAHVLAAGGERRVALIDLNLQFGDALSFVNDGKPTSTLADIAHDISRLDASFLTGSTVKVAPNFSILAAPEDVSKAMEVKAEHVDAILALAVTLYDFVLLDVGRNLNTLAIRALDRAHRIYPVLQAGLPSIRNANKLLTVFKSLGYAPNKTELIVNRFEKTGEIGLADLQRSLGPVTLLTVPESYKEVTASINRGVPLVEISRANPVSKSLADLALSLNPRQEQNTSFFARLFRKA
jgi:pilus assembly protein CpaE